jgi:hypothetical protein
MKRIGYSSLAMLSACVMAMALASAAFATPTPTSAVVKTRIFNDCPLSTLTTTNAYPTLIEFDETWDDQCVGFANFHNWRFSTDGTNPAAFGNNNDFRFSAIVTITGNGACEAGLQIAPWWSPEVDGRLQARIADGEIAAFGGRLPFYSFSAPPHNVRYMGGPIFMEMEYRENGLSMASPATIEYRIFYNMAQYTSGPRAFDQGNPAEGHGSWGILDPAWVGGFVQDNLGTAPGSVPRHYNVKFNDILFTCIDCPTPALTSSWGRIKSIYR